MLIATADPTTSLNRRQEVMVPCRHRAEVMLESVLTCLNEEQIEEIWQQQQPSQQHRPVRLRVMQEDEGEQIVDWHVEQQRQESQQRATNSQSSQPGSSNQARQPRGRTAQTQTRRSERLRAQDFFFQ